MIDAATANESSPSARKLATEETIIGLQLRDGNLATAAAREHLSELCELFDAPLDRIQRAIYELVDEGGTASPASIALRLADDDGLQEAGGRQYLANMAAAAPAAIGGADISRRARVAIADWKEIARDQVLRNFVEDRQLDSEALAEATALAARFEPSRELAETCASTFAGQDIPEREELVEGLIPRDAVTILAGDGGTGKSLLALQLSAAILLKTSWIGRVVFRNGPVLFLSAEDTTKELHRRLAAIVEHEQASFKQLAGLHLIPFVGEESLLAVAGSRNTIEPTPLFAKIERRVAAIKPVLIVVDTLADFFGGDENNRAQARQFIARLRGLAMRHDSTALLLAHPSLQGLSSGSGMSGSTGWSNSARSRLYFERVKSSDVEDDPDARVLKCKKFNYGPAGGEIKLRWERGVFTHRPDSTLSSAASMVQAKADRVFLEMLAAYTAEGRSVHATLATGYAPSVFATDKHRNEGVTKHAFVDAMNRLFEVKRIRIEALPGPPSKRRTHLVIVGGDDQ